MLYFFSNLEFFFFLIFFILRKNTNFVSLPSNHLITWQGSKTCIYPKNKKNYKISEFEKQHLNIFNDVIMHNETEMKKQSENVE